METGDWRLDWEQGRGDEGTADDAGLGWLANNTRSA